MSRVLLIASIFLCSTACSSKSKPKPEPTDKGSATTPQPEAPAMAKKGGYCPSMVAGATTSAELSGGSVIVKVVSTDKATAIAIQKRAEGLVREKSDNSTTGKHDQKGSHGGRNGLCPVAILDGATAKVANDATGVAITITPKDKPDELKKLIDDRIAKATEWAKSSVKPGLGNLGAVGGASAGHGANHTGNGDGKGPRKAKLAGNCPSTVFGAETKNELKGKTVVVTITAKDKDAVAGIKKRTAARLAHKPGGGPGHDQKGTHGGGDGLCPVFAIAGATATSKTLANGVAVTITPKDGPDGLKKQIDDRIAKVSEWTKANVKAGDAGTSAGVGGGKGAHGTNHSGQGDGKGKERGAG